MPFEVPALRPMRDRNEIVEELFHSRQHTNVVGIILREQNKLITTAVLDIQDTAAGEKLIRFRETDLHGYPLDKNPVLLGEIESVIHFNTLFDDPVYIKIRERRTDFGNHVAA